MFLYVFISFLYKVRYEQITFVSLTLCIQYTNRNFISFFVNTCLLHNNNLKSIFNNKQHLTLHIFCLFFTPRLCAKFITTKPIIQSEKERQEIQTIVVFIAYLHHDKLMNLYVKSLYGREKTSSIRESLKRRTNPTNVWYRILNQALLIHSSHQF